MTSRAPVLPASAAARPTALREDSDPSVPTTTVRYALTGGEPTGNSADAACAGSLGRGREQVEHAAPPLRTAPGRHRALGWSRRPADDEETAIHPGSTAHRDPVRGEVRGLTKTFGAVRAVDDLTFTVEPGSVTGFLGPNGAGKTTTMRMVLGLERPDSGTATFNGAPYASLPEPAKTGGAGLETAFPPARSGRNHLRVYCRAAGLPLSRADEVLTEVGLAEAGRRRAGGYSLGMRQP